MNLLKVPLFIWIQEIIIFSVGIATILVYFHFKCKMLVAEKNVLVTFTGRYTKQMKVFMLILGDHLANTSRWMILSFIIKLSLVVFLETSYKFYESFHLKVPIKLFLSAS